MPFTVLTIRMAVVLGIIVVLPVLAIPPVNSWLNRQLRTEPIDEEVSRDAVHDMLEIEVPSPSTDSTSTAVVAARVPGPGELDNNPDSESPRWQPERTAEIQEQLKLIGVRYMVLEKLPGDDRYLFRCEVDATNRGTYGLAFESVDQNPQRAMERVLADIQRWRQGRANAGHSNQNEGRILPRYEPE